ncbi:MAG: radical SAM protein [Nitrosomonas sp.]|nr:radical SAM protein [Nitrosomonas sp.]
MRTDNHNRDSAGLVYVYPVISRRAGGLSIGINLNPNNACNWRCVYCQVPDLKRGSAPAIDLVKLESELCSFLEQLLFGDFMQQHVPPTARIIHDIALSGNGEPTSTREFSDIITLIGKVIRRFPLPAALKLRLITNGSLINRAGVQTGLRQMAKLNGEVWFKVDSVTKTGRSRINHTRSSLQQMRENLQLSASLCPTWLQTCVFNWNGLAPDEAEIQAYLYFVRTMLQEGTDIKGVLLYSLARPSLQAEADSLSGADEHWIEQFAGNIRKLGILVQVNT